MTIAPADAALVAVRSVEKSSTTIVGRPAKLETTRLIWWASLRAGMMMVTSGRGAFLASGNSGSSAKLRRDFQRKNVMPSAMASPIAATGLGGITRASVPW
ncbi:MAG: hypothetical protein WBW33_09115, partial [Bryobacteraceae bacterium]